MCLVNNPMPNGRQNLSLGRNVPEQQGMVGDHDIGLSSAAARAMHETFIGEERAKAAGALTRGGRKVGPIHASPAYAEGVEIAIGHLAHICIDYGHGRQRVCRIFGRLDFGDAAAHALQFTQARVVVIALERAIAQSTLKLLSKFWQLVIHKLIGEIVRFGSHAHGHTIAFGGLGKRNEVGHRLTDAGPRLDHAMRSRLDRIAHLKRHGDLLLARLIRRVHLVDEPARGVGSL